ncbi:MAG: hypothetical protein KatS3mg096_692 [Candidatus Parcubacteria bacterium]|nr:MAG: hypothetical protein KatS3mg096_692 [Candidatus Parcubacteria bacterium]
MLNEINEEKIKLIYENPFINLEEEEEKAKQKLKDIFFTIKDIFQYYCDLNEEYYTIIPLWVIGTYFHKNFPSYPYLFLNATKGSGKSRTVNLIVTLSKEGIMLNSLTEAVLFRTNGTLGIDEFESVERKGKEGLRELLNSAYKQGTLVKRMKKVKTLKGEDQVVETFEVYRPIVMANIWGMEDVLGDRCITLILEKSNKPDIVNLIEIFRDDSTVKKVIEDLKEISEGSLCRFFRLCRKENIYNIYKEWNNFIKENVTNVTNITNTTNVTNSTRYIKEPDTLFKVIKEMKVMGRDLELCFPLLLIANEISEDLLEETANILSDIILKKREEEFIENKDINLIDFVSQKEESESFVSIKTLTYEFKNWLSSEEEWINEKWMGRALKRLNLIKYKRKIGNRGREVILDVKKAKEKIKMFK